MSRVFLAVVVFLISSLVPVEAGAADDLPVDFPPNPVFRGGIGGSIEGCKLNHYPIVFVHDEGEDARTYFEPGGLAEHMLGQGFSACELWAVKIGDRGESLRSLEELTDDIKYFIYSVLAYTGSQKVQLLAGGTSAVLAHATMKKYNLYNLVYSVAYVDGLFHGRRDCTDQRCFGGEPSCCHLKPNSVFLRRLLEPDEAPHSIRPLLDKGSVGHVRYLTMGSSRKADGWMLDGAWNIRFPDMDILEEPGSLSLLVSFFKDARQDCTADVDGDGYCSEEAGGTDCDDSDSRIFPGARELPDDGVDQDCNRRDIDSSIAGYLCEVSLSDPSDPSEPISPRQPPEEPGSKLVFWMLVALAILISISFALVPSTKD